MTKALPTLHCYPGLVIFNHGKLKAEKTVDCTLHHFQFSCVSKNTFARKSYYCNYEARKLWKNHSETRKGFPHVECGL